MSLLWKSVILYENLLGAAIISDYYFDGKPRKFFKKSHETGMKQRKGGTPVMTSAIRAFTCSATCVPQTEYSRLKGGLSGSKDHTPIIQKVSRFMADLGQIHTIKHVQF